MRNRFPLVIFLVSIVLLASAWAKDDSTLEKIRKAIKEKGAKWEAGETWISRLSPEERRKYMGALPPKTRVVTSQPLSGVTFPDSFDWRDYNGYDWTTTVKNQTTCGNCWAYAACAALEAVVKITLNEPDQNVDLSELYLTSCTGRGCELGWDQSSTLEYIRTHGVPDQGCFPGGLPPAPCADSCDDKHLRTIFIESWGQDAFGVPLPDVIKDRLMTYGPLTVHLDVYADFFNYQTGIYEHVYGDYEAGHAVCMVGWGHAGEDSFWICKNSWGSEDWGEDGWFKIRMIRSGVQIDKDVWHMTVDSASIPRITVTVPNGGEAWMVGTTQSIRWHAPSPYFSGNVKIEYSTNDGSSWNLITGGTGDDGSFTWADIPDSGSRDCRIRISDAVDGSPLDVSDSTFFITPLGDVNCDVWIDLVDIVYLINYVFQSGPEPIPLESGNVNCDWSIDAADIVFLVNYVLKSGPKPEC